MRALITGGSGLIGARLADALSRAGHAVTLFDRRPPPDDRHAALLADVRDLDALCTAVAGQDIVYHLAAEHADNVRPVSLYDEVNVGGAANLARAAERAGVRRIIFTSSVAVYGDNALPMTEDTPHAYINDYGRTKSLAEAALRTWAEAAPDRGLTIVRPAVVFGPGNRGNVYNLLNQIHSGLFVMVGDGANRKSMAYVENVAVFLAGLPPEARGLQVYNYADKPDFDMKGLVSMLRAELGRGDGPGPRLPLGLALALGRLATAASAVLPRPLPISAVRVRKFVANTEVDARRALAAGFVPPHDMRQALIETLRRDLPRRVPDIPRLFWAQRQSLRRSR